MGNSWWDRNRILVIAYVIMFFMIVVAIDKFTLLERC